MRQIGALIMGIWYSLILALCFDSLATELTVDSNYGAYGAHYVVRTILWLIAIYLGGMFAGLVSKTFCRWMSFFSTLPAVALVIFFLFDHAGEFVKYELLPEVFGWRPTYLGGALVFFIFSTLMALLAGANARHILNEEEDEKKHGGIPTSATDSLRILGVRWGHYIWLWAPIACWASLSIITLFVVTIDLNLGWFWAQHSGLYSNWRWWVYGILTIIVTCLPFGFLKIGMRRSWIALAADRGLGLAPVLLRFLGYGVGLAIIASLIVDSLALYGFSQLPVAGAIPHPWWMLFPRG